MGGRCEHSQHPKPASRPGDARVQAARTRHFPGNYSERQNLRGLGFPCDRRCSEIREDRSQTLRRNPPKHHPRNGLTYTTPAKKGYVQGASKRKPEKSYRRIARRSNPLVGVTP